MATAGNDATFADDSNSQIGSKQGSDLSSTGNIEAVYVEYCENMGGVDNLSVYEEAEQVQADKSKTVWRCFVLPVTICVALLLVTSIVLGII